MASGSWGIIRPSQPCLGGQHPPVAWFSVVAGSGTLGQGLGRGFPVGLSFSVRIPQAGPLLSPAGSSSGSWLQGGTQRGWTESSLPLLNPSHQAVLLSAQCLQGPEPLSGILTFWSLSPLCVSCTKCSTPKTGHNVEGDGGTIWVCQS